MVHGYYVHKGVRVNMKVTAGHVMMGPDALEKKHRKRRASPRKTNNIKEKRSRQATRSSPRKKKQLEEATISSSNTCEFPQNKHTD